MVDHDGYEFPTGWVERPDDVAAVCRGFTDSGHELVLSRAAPSLFERDDDASVFLWEAEQLVLGRVLPCWNQNPVGSCVGFGFTRAAQDLMLNEIAAGEAEIWPGAELAPEITYIGSRVEVGGGSIKGDGSVGAWAAKWLAGWGVVKREQYGSVDLSKYDPRWVRANQSRGVPEDVEAAARLRPVTTIAQLRSSEDVWAAIGARKPVPFCFSMGFLMNADREGFCIPGGKTWNHCETLRGRFVHPRRGPSYVRQGSWRNPDGSVSWPGPNRVTVETVDRGPVLLPEGCAAVDAEIIDAICKPSRRQPEVYSLAGLTGWKRLKLTMDPYA